MPSIVTRPSVGSKSRATSEASVVLPEPVSPTSASVVPARDVEVDAVERGHVVPGVGEADALEADVAADRGGVDVDRVGGLVDLDGEVEVLEDALEQRQRADHLDAGVEQPHQRPEQLALQGGERDQGADRHRAGGHRQPGAEVDDGRDRREDDAHRRHPPAAGQLRAQLEVDQPGAGLGEPADQRRAGAHRLAELDAVDRQALVDGDVEVGELALLERGDLAAHPGDPAAEPDRGRQHDQRDQREPPGQGDHRDGGGDRGGQVGGDRGRGRGDDRLHAADVVGDPRLHLAGAGAGEEADRLALQVGEDVGPQPVHDVLADLRADPGLDDAEHRGDGGDDDHAGGQQDEQAQVLLGQRGVDDAAQQERRGQADDRRRRR